MRRKYSRRVSLFLISVSIFATYTIPHLTALDLSLNNRNLSVLDYTTLEAYSQNSVIPLQTLYPWMESVDYLEVQSGMNRAYWNDIKNWNDIMLIDRNGIWEIHVGQDIFSNPDRISIRGIRQNIKSVSIWSAIENPELKTDLFSALIFRDITINWRDTSHLKDLLANPPPEGLPNIMFLDQIDLLRLKTLLHSFQPISSRTSQWFSLSALAPERTGNPELPLAIDAYQPEAALLFLLAENSALFDDEGRLPDNFTKLLDWISASREPKIIITDKPEVAITSGHAVSAVLLPSSTEISGAGKQPFFPASPPGGATNITRLQFAAIPLTDDSSTLGVSSLLLKDIAGFSHRQIDKAAVQIPMDPRVFRFFDAYERIGRLAITGQLESQEAVDLITQYVNEKN